MDGLSAERAVLEGAISSELAEVFRVLADTDLGSGPKYPAQLLRALSRTVASRAYGKPMLELCHLMRIAAAVGGRHGWPGLVFGVPVARAAALRALVQKGADSNAAYSGLELIDDGVTLTYPDAAFHVTYGRMAFLVALAELLVTALGYRAIDEVVQELLEALFESASASRHANRLSRLFYDYLKDHLSTAQSLRVFASLIGFLERDRGQSFSLDDLDDDAVFDYWSAVTTGQTDGVDMWGFRSVLERVATLRSAIEEATERHALGTPRSIGPDRSSGEVDPDAILSVLEAHEDPADDLSVLQTKPAAAVKLLTGREMADLTVLSTLGRQAPTLALSVLRAETLGVAQGRVSQALRRRAEPDVVSGLLDLSGCETYGDRLARWHDLDARMKRMALAALAVLIEAGRVEAAREVLAHLPSADLTGLRDRVPEAAGANVVALRPARAPDIVGALQDRTLVGEDVADLVDEARRSLKGLSRAGFQPKDRLTPSVGDGLSVGLPVLRRLRSALVAVLRRAESQVPAADVDGRFLEDSRRFAIGLRALYGVGE